MEEKRFVTPTIQHMIVFNTAKLKIYTHECVVINRPIPLYLNLTEQTDTDKLLNENTTVYGLKTFGLTFLSAKNDYRAPYLYMFIEPEFGHNDKQYVISSSFVTIGKLDWIAYDKFTNTSLTIVPSAQNENYICSRLQKNEEFDKVFQKGLKRQDYNWTMVVVTVKGDNSVKELNTTVGPLRTPTQRHNAKFLEVKPVARAFSILSKNIDKNIEKVGIPISASTSNCKLFPILKDICMNGTSKVTACKYTKSVLDLNPFDYTSNATLAPLKWKRDALYLIEEIFVIISPQLDPSAVESVGNIFWDIYILEAHGSDSKLPKKEHPQWKLLEKELNGCKNIATPMEFSQYIVPYNELGEQIRLPEVTFPPHEEITVQTENSNFKNEEEKYNWVVARHDKTEERIFYHIEAVDVDFDLNMVIDYQWKLFSTVLGFCNKAFGNTNIFKLLMTMFQESFLNHNIKAWTNSELNDIYVYIKGDSYPWLDRVLEGAYIHSRSERLRTPRPILTSDGHFNYFILTKPSL